MKDEFGKTRLSLLCLGQKIENGDYPHNGRHWGGADAVIASEIPKPTEAAFYTDPRYVLTPFSHELSWLFEEMRDILAPFLDGCNRIEFYGRLANMANRYQKGLRGKKDNKKDLLLAVLHEAFAMFEEMEEGALQFLTMAEGNTIFDDLMERAESEGYLGVDETRNSSRKWKGGITMLDISIPAQEFLKKLQQPKQYKQIASRIFSLLKDPVPPDTKHLSGYPGYLRVDSGEYRIIYTRTDSVSRVIFVGKRNDYEVHKEMRRSHA